MDLLCRFCDREIIENESEYKYYIATLHKKDNKSLYENYTFNNISNLDEFDKKLSDYISIHNKDYDIYLINCSFKLEFEKNFILNIETNYIHNIESEKLILLYHTISNVMNYWDINFVV